MGADIDTLAINAVRILSMDAVQKAESGHPGTPMALAPLAYALYTKHMKHDPADPQWPDRDRFVLSCGHASMLLYSSLFLSGYDLSLDDLKGFRQWESKTPGHPELHYTPGVETTTGPLGQGIANAVGMAVAEAHLAAVFNRLGHEIVSHHTWFICSDGDLMEGISHEAASYAGHQKLGKLIGFYDDNRITIDGSTDLTFSDDTSKRFESYGWQVLQISDVNDLSQIDRAVATAKADASRPTLVVTRTHIGFGSPNKQDTAKAHGEPLGVDEVRLTREKLGWPLSEPFALPAEAITTWRRARITGAEAHTRWSQMMDSYRAAYPADAQELDRRLAGKRPAEWSKALPMFTKENGAIASRAAFGAALNATAAALPELVGGSADLTPSNNTSVKAWKNFSPDDRSGRYMHYGIREHGMGAIMNGMAIHGGVVPYGGTFLIFSDYMRPAIRLAAFMEQHVIYVFTHDSIGLGEDGPTHQPVEQLSALRAIPNLTILRPADASETAEAWKAAVNHHGGPVALVLTRQKLGFIDRSAGLGDASGVGKGGYVLAGAGENNEVVILASGSEVGLALKARDELSASGVSARVVSMPSMELFAAQEEAYRDSILPRGVRRIAVEAGHPMSWYRWVGDSGTVIGITRFGASAPYERLYTELGLTVNRIVAAARGRPA